MGSVKVEEYGISFCNVVYICDLSDFGKTVFLTREEAGKRGMKGDGWMPIDNILADILILCDEVIAQKKNDWKDMNEEQKIEWIRRFISLNAHPVVIGHECF